ncbi:hypothetical protein [Streptomyces uncialis]|uniref:hypothetical protein n=1 Tax=Streptomyces uncialis TaxID=1048205 RepID=UPI002256F105|nr:hypothetical protein [Streptomyces uncialis]MCX4661005.1 hypothetical protein [Streptomyces uncialis]
MPTLTEPETELPETIESDTDDPEPTGPGQPAGVPEGDQGDQGDQGETITFRRRNNGARRAA